jgi:predicted DNA-binding transcriptional regulator AlpA
MLSFPRLRSTSWLAERLNISVTTVERLRMQNPIELPPHVTIGRSIRYDDHVVEQWLRERQHLPAASTMAPPVPAVAAQEGAHHE